MNSTQGGNSTCSQESAGSLEAIFLKHIKEIYIASKSHKALKGLISSFRCLDTLVIIMSNAKGLY